MRYFLFAVLSVAALTLGTGCGKRPGAESLIGKITVSGRPVPFVSIIVTGVDGKVAGGSANGEGQFTIPDPPKGPLKIQLMEAARGTIPARYTRPDNGLLCDYNGGTRTLDINL